jgi:hypothetical protein
MPGKRRHNHRGESNERTLMNLAAHAGSHVLHKRAESFGGTESMRFTRRRALWSSLLKSSNG